MALKRGGRLRPVGLGKRWKAQLDALVRRVVLARDKCCVRCGGTSGLQVSHVRSRRYLSTRWALFNVKLFCAGCHLWWHHNPLSAVAWFREHFPEQAKRLELIEHVGATGAKIDREAIRLELEMEIKKYE